MAKMIRQIQLVDVGDIEANTGQPRKYFDEESLRELAESIKGVGIIQPLSVQELGFGKYKLISGERRLRAAKVAGLSAVPCVVIQAQDEDFELIALVENIQREDLNYIEEAQAYLRLMNEFGFTQQQLADRVGKKQSTISNKLRILRLGSEVIEKLIGYDLSERHARALLQVPDTQTRLEIVETIKKNDLNVRQTDELANRMKSGVLLNASKRNIRNLFNYRIYTNTIKQAYEAIKKTGLDAGYKEVQYGDRIEVTITIPVDSEN